MNFIKLRFIRNFSLSSPIFIYSLFLYISTIKATLTTKSPCYNR